LYGEKFELDKYRIETITVYSYDFEDRLIGVQIQKEDKLTVAPLPTIPLVPHFAR
jgi:hypothetical protein